MAISFKKFLFQNAAEGFAEEADLKAALQIGQLKVTGNGTDQSGVGIDMSNAKVSNLAAPVAGSDAANKAYVDAQVAAASSSASGDSTALADELAAEVARAQAAETALNSALAAEIARATSAETTLTGALASEASRAQGAENTLTGALASEASRAQGAENTLTGALASEVSRAQGAENTLSGSISAEVARAQGAENTLSGSISAEVARAQGAESVLTADLAAEAARAKAAEGGLTSDLATEVSRAKAAEGVLTADLATEVSRAQAAEGVLTANLATEVSRAQAAEGVLTSDLATEVSRAKSAEATLTADLTAEVLRAQGAEGVLTADLATEVSRAKAAEGVLTADLATEVSRATAAENTLTSNLTAEVSRAQGAEAKLTSDLAAEVAARASFAQGISWKASVRVASTANIADLSAVGNGAIDGVTLAAGDRVLLKDQSSGAQNGIYSVTSVVAGIPGTDGHYTNMPNIPPYNPGNLAGGFHQVWVPGTPGTAGSAALARVANEDLKAGVAVFVEQGAANSDSGWVISTDNPIVLDTTAIAWARFTGLSDVAVGNGITKSGKTLSAVVNSAAGIGLDVSGIKALLGSSMTFDASGNIVPVMGDGMAALGSAITAKSASSERLSVSSSGLDVVGVPSTWKIGGTATDVTAAELQTLSGGSSTEADSLHYHAKSLERWTAGGSINARRAVYMDAAGGIKEASFSSASTARVLGLAVDALAPAAEGFVQTSGLMSMPGASLTPGVRYFLNDIGGLALFDDVTPGSRVIQLGIAKSAEVLAIRVFDYGMKSAV